MKQPMREAVELAADVYRSFMTNVVEGAVIKDREGILDDKRRKALEAGKIIDTRVVRLMSISGKGGYSEDPHLCKRYAESANVTLLDHLLSVVRGAITFASLDTLTSNPDANRESLRADLCQLAAIAFLHDLDKDLELERDNALPLEAVAERWTRYRLDRFVGEQRTLAPDQVRYLIEHAEATQAHRSPPVEYPPRRLSNLMGYVALADKLEGLWLKEGIDAVLERLRNDRTLATDLMREWAVIDLFDPHHPFLIDELQRAVSACCRPIPPLIEVHQDGRLMVLVPADQVGEIREKAVKKVCKFLARGLFGLRVNVSNRGVPEILDSQPDHDQLSEFMGTPMDLADEKLAKLFLVKSELSVDESLTRQLDELLGDIGLGPTWPKALGQTITPYPNPATLSDEAQHHLRTAAHLALLLNHKKVVELPDYDAREQAILKAVGQDRPAWMAELQDHASRRTFTSLWATRLAADDSELQERIWGEGGILQLWLEGTDDGRGLRNTIEGIGGEILDALVAHLSQRLDAKPTIRAKDTGNRCIFTDEPVAKSATFKSADNLYEIKKSAFSGREGRLENIESAQGETHISPVSYAEHRLRALVHATFRGKPDGIPTLLSSPSTTGLFAALALNNEQDFSTLSVYDMARGQVSKGLVYRGIDAYSNRFRVARFERVPEPTADQVNLLRLLLRATRRIGRPMHLFRGLPNAEKAFFAFDAMPRRLSDLIGGNRLRIEQIPSALDRLETALLILETNGLGFEVFDRYTRPATRLGAVCLAWAYLHDEKKDNKPDRGACFRHEFEQLLKEDNMSDTEAPLVKLGRAAARIQQRPRPGASTNEEMLTFNLSLETAIDAWRIGQRDPESLAMAVAGELETNLMRKKKVAAKENRDGKKPQQECISFAHRFVVDVWFGVLQGRPPAQTSRRILGSIYRIAFLTTPRQKVETDVDTSND